MYTALYYPHTQPKNTEILKNALLLWDKIEFIVPYSGYELKSTDGNKLIDEALELIAVPRVPDDDDKQKARSLIEELVTSNLPSDFLLNESNQDDGYLIYPEKFDIETWRMLKGLNLSQLAEGSIDGDWRMSGALGLTVMSILAEVCAGSTKRMVTDRGQAYELLARSTGQLHGGTLGVSSDALSNFTTIAIDLVDPSQFTLDMLIKLRKKEAESSNTSLRKLRHGFTKSVDSYVKEISASKNKGDIVDITREYKNAMEEDYKELLDALELKSTNTLLSKEVCIGILAAAGTAIPPMFLAGQLGAAVSAATGVLGIAALVKESVNYNPGRRAILNKHAMSWMFQAANNNRTIVTK